MSVFVEFPEEIRIVGSQLLIERFGSICLGERLSIRIQCEKDHTQCKQINNIALIWLFI